LFTLNALRNLRQTGSLFRSSKNLAEKLVIPLTSNSQINIIELPRWMMYLDLNIGYIRLQGTKRWIISEKIKGWTILMS